MSDLSNSIKPISEWTNSLPVVLSPVVTPGNYASLIIVPILPENSHIIFMAQRLKGTIYHN